MFIWFSVCRGDGTVQHLFWNSQFKLKVKFITGWIGPGWGWRGGREQRGVGGRWGGVGGQNCDFRCVCCHFDLSRSVFDVWFWSLHTFTLTQEIFALSNDVLGLSDIKKQAQEERSKSGESLNRHKFGLKDSNWENTQTQAWVLKITQKVSFCTTFWLNLHGCVNICFWPWMSDLSPLTSPHRQYQPIREKISAHEERRDLFFFS